MKWPGPPYGVGGTTVHLAGILCTIPAASGYRVQSRAHLARPSVLGLRAPVRLRVWQEPRHLRNSGRTGSQIVFTAGKSPDSDSGNENAGTRALKGEVAEDHLVS